jgi:hypothetical protein
MTQVPAELLPALQRFRDVVDEYIGISDIDPEYPKTLLLAAAGIWNKALARHRNATKDADKAFAANPVKYAIDEIRKCHAGISGAISNIPIKSSVSQILNGSVANTHDTNMALDSLAVQLTKKLDDVIGAVHSYEVNSQTMMEFLIMEIRNLRRVSDSPANFLRTAC